MFYAHLKSLDWSSGKIIMMLIQDHTHQIFIQLWKCIFGEKMNGKLLIVQTYMKLLFVENVQASEGIRKRYKYNILGNVGCFRFD